MNRRLVFAPALLWGLLISAGYSSVWAAEKGSAEKTASELLPASTIAYAELSRPAELLDLILEHPLRQRVEKFDQVRQLLENPQYSQFQAVIKLVEQQIGMKWHEALGAVSEGGIHIGFDPQSEGLAVIVRSKDQATLEKLRDTLFKLARNEAQRQGNEDPLKSTEYRGITAYSAGNARFATLGSLLVLVNNDSLGKAILDNYLDDNKNSLANNDKFKAARKLISGNPTAWGYLDIAAIREAGLVKGLYKNKTDNVLVELLVGGLLGTLQKTPYVVTSLDLEKSRFALKVTTPHDPAWVGEAREYYFGPGGKGTALPLLQPQETLLSLSTYRDFSGMWMRSADIFEDNVDAGFAKASATLTTLFSGKDFGEDVLGSFKPEVQFVAARQRFEDDGPVPAIKIPAFAFVFQFKDTEKVQGDFRRMFQSLIGFLNITGAQNGQPQLDLDMEKEGKTQIITASYVPEEDEKKSKQAKINFNFSPSVAFADDYFIISSTKKLTRELVGIAAKSNRQKQNGGESSRTNTQLNFVFSNIREALNDNRKQLVTNNMLSQGRDREEAEKQIGLLLEAVGLFRNLNLQLSTNKSTVQFEIEANLTE